jgi:Cu(I)/Ag(I) efflux system membrane fusion protein
MKDIKPGAEVAFEFVERQPGGWVITAIAPAPPSAGAAQPAVKSHSGH